MPDLIEDFIAFLYTTGSRKLPGRSGSDDQCPECGAELEENEATGEMRCPVCGWTE